MNVHLILVHDPHQGLKYLLSLISICIEELTSTPQIITLPPNQPPRNEKLPLLSNPIP